MSPYLKTNKQKHLKKCYLHSHLALCLSSKYFITVLSNMVSTTMISGYFRYLKCNLYGLRCVVNTYQVGCTDYSTCAHIQECTHTLKWQYFYVIDYLKYIKDNFTSFCSINDYIICFTLNFYIVLSLTLIKF